MRGAAFVVSVGVGMGVLSCATPAATSAQRPPAKSVELKNGEVVVIGRGPDPMPGMKPQDEGTEFYIMYNHTIRCTKVKPTAKNPRGIESCRDLSNNQSRDPDPGRVERRETQGGW